MQTEVLEKPHMETAHSPKTSLHIYTVHGVTSQKTVILTVATIRTWNLKQKPHFVLKMSVYHVAGTNSLLHVPT